MPISAEQAEVLALKVLGWLAANSELMPIFMGASGTGVDDLKTRAQDPEFLGAVLDFVLMDDSWVIAFCDAAGVPYPSLAEARMALPGGAQHHWT